MDTEVQVRVSEPPKKPKGLGQRHMQASLLCLCLFVAYAMRVNLSVAIVAMTQPKEGHATDITVLHWKDIQQGYILSSFFWGYLVTQVPAGQLSRRFGPKYLLAGAMFVCSVFTLLGPFISENYSWIAFCLTRVVQGLAQGFFYPSINTHMAKWITPSEKNRIFSFIIGVGTLGGTIVTLFVAGYLAATPWGWPSIFYSTGFCGLLWVIAWLLIGADSPDTHTTISDSEKNYIKGNLNDNSTDSRHMKTPWKQILTSPPVWAILIAHLGQNWGYWTILTMLPSYMSKVLGFNIKNNGMVSSLPYVAALVCSILFSWAADYINKKQLLPPSVARKFWNSVAHWGGAAALVSLSFISSNVTATVALLTLSVGLNAGVYMGFLSNHLELSPNFAGLLMGITNGFSNITSILGPIVTGYIISDGTSREKWMTAFYVSALIFFIGNLVFIIFGSSKVQHWNEPPEQKNEEKVEKIDK